ncbi:MAG: DUF2007 domain-containing protein [Spirochaetales bacterium]|nr:DUF2007 domain-containing protein [Spirochaetales bacterium]
MDNSEEKIVEIYSSNDEFEIKRASDYLEEKAIKTLVRNLGTQDLFGLGRLGTSINPMVGEYELCVLENDKEKAFQALTEIFPELGSSDDDSPEDKQQPLDNTENDDFPADQSDENRAINIALAQSIILNILWLFGIGSVISFIRSFKFRKRYKGFFIVNTILSFIGVLGSIVFLLNNMLSIRFFSPVSFFEWL